MTIFKDKDAAVAELQERSSTVATYLQGRLITPTIAWSSLIAAEAEVARKLQVSLEPVEVFSVKPPTADEIVALDGKRYVVEPGYDMPPDFFGAGGWGCIKLSIRPVIELKEIKFIYPPPLSSEYRVPPEWSFIDNKSGIVQFIPAPSVAGVPASVISMHALSMGRTVPQMIRVRYSAGLTSDDEHMPEITDLIMRLALLRQIKFAPQSGSISADGLSRSISADVDKFQTAIDADLENLHQAIKGLVWGVL